MKVYPPRLDLNEKKKLELKYINRFGCAIKI